MPRLETFYLKLKTGERGLPGPPQYVINGFPLDFDEVSGSTEPGGVLEATAHPQSFPHSLVLRGPKQGVWDIEGLEITYHVAGREPYSVKLGGVELDEESDLNLWYEPPARVFDV
jgi:hypothetical protein